MQEFNRNKQTNKTVPDGVIKNHYIVVAEVAG